MLNDGLKYSDSRMANESEFIESLALFDLKSTEGSYTGGPVLFRRDNICYTDGSDVHDLIIGGTGYHDIESGALVAFGFAAPASKQTERV